MTRARPRSETTPGTAWVRSDRLETLARRIERLGRRAERLGQPTPELSLTEKRRRPSGVEETLVELRGDAPRLAHWEIVAELHHEEGEPNEIEVLGEGASLDEARWVSAPARCDHCGQRRKRVTTIILRHRSGQLAQVGTSCLEDFTGDRDPFARLVSARAREGVRQALTEAASNVEYVPLRDYLAQVCALARTEGFASVRDVRGESATATFARAFERLREGPSAGTHDREHAGALEAWVLHELGEREELSGYEERLVAVFQLADAVPEDSLPLVASAWLAHERASSPAGRAEWLDEVGAIVEVDVEVLDVRATKRRSRFGEVHWHRLRDSRGHELAWFSVGSVLEVGERVRIRGRVRRHGRFAGRAVTVLTGCRVMP